MMHHASRPLASRLTATGCAAPQPWVNSSSLVAGLLLLCPVADVLTGLHFVMTGEDQVISASRVWKALVIAVALLSALHAGRSTPHFAGLFASAAGLGLLALVNGLLYGGTGVNLLAFIQLQLFFCAVLILLTCISPQRAGAIIGMYMAVIWCCVGVTVLLSRYANLGIELYQGHGTSGLFRAGNDACYQFVCASCYLLFAKPRSRSVFLILLASSSATLWMIGAKAGLLGLPLCVGWCAAARLSGNKTFTFFLFSIVAMITVFFCEPLFVLLVNYLPGAERYHYFLRDRDVLHVILSGRNRLADAAFEVIGGYNAWQWLTGTGVDNFRRQVADVLYLDRVRRPVEMDWVDLLGAKGVLGICWFYGVLTKIVRTSLVQRSRDTLVISACMVFTFLFSVSAGHVATSASSLTMVAVLCAWTFHRSMEEEPGRDRVPASGLHNPRATVPSLRR